MAGRPAKSVALIKLEGKSHRTKAELKIREEGEKALASGVAMKEKSYVRQNPIAHKEFLRIKKLLGEIEHNDALQENIINRYCQIYAECIEFENKCEEFYRSLQTMESEVRDKMDSGEVSWLDYMKLRSSYQSQIIGLDKQVQSKREMLLKIEKENLMTIASALRSIPKKPEEKPNKYKGMFG